MNNCKSLNTIINAEQNFSVNAWMLSGIHIWPIIRNQLGLALLRVESGYETELNKAARLSKLISFPVSMIQSVLGRIESELCDSRVEKKSPAADVLFLKLSQDRLMKTPQGLMYDIHCDPIQDLFVSRKMSSLSLEWTSNGSYIAPRYSPSRIIQDDINRMKLMSVLGRPRKNDATSFFVEYSMFVLQVKESFPSIELPSIQYIASVARFISRLSDYFVEQINTSRAKLGFVADYSNNIGMAFCLACRKSRIPSVDIQHGVGGQLNCIYGQWTNIPSDGYELLPRFFWSWSNEDADAINKWAHEGSVADYHQAICGGNPLVGLWKRESDFSKHYDAIIESFVSKGKTILVALQNGYGIPDVLLETIRLSPAEWSWWIRYHPYSPAQEKSEIRSKLLHCDAKAKIEFEFTNDLPLMALLKHVDLCVTPWSAVCLDAIAFNVKVILVHETGRDLFAAQIEGGLAVVALNVTSLLEETTTTPKRSQNELKDSDDFCQANKAISYILEFAGSS